MCERTNLSIWLVIFAFFAALSTGSIAGGKIIYVDEDAAGANEGSSWENAYTFLQEAFTDAETSAKPVEIHVAQGVYRPNEGLMAIPGFDWRTTTFHLINGVTLKGGYAGSGETDPNARDVETYETVLSGDLNANDSNEFTNNEENSYHVVTGSDTDETAVMDGFTIIAGNANGPLLGEHPNFEYRLRYGAGMCNVSGSPSLINCTFRRNLASSDGGGMYNYGSSPELTNCTFSENLADFGGGICNSTSDTVLTNCTFSGNKARDGGGIVNSTYSYPTMTNCTFSRNEADGDGGGICIRYGSAHISRCTFEDNWASDGGGLLNEGGRLWLENCTFTRNVASGLQYADVGYGGGLHIESYLVGSKIDNCIFIANIASVGGGAHFGYRGMAIPLSRGEKTLLTGCNFVRNQASCGGATGQSTSALDIENCVFRQNSALYTGGAISTLSSITNLANCIFSGNSASIEGASILAQGGQEVTMHGHEWPQDFKLTLDSCTLRGNRTAIGQSLACRSHDSEDLDSTFISNCILDNDGNEIHNPDGSQITIDYTNLRGRVSSVHDPCEAVIWGKGNIDVDPCFAEPGSWDPNGTPADPNDDFWIDGDYHLKSQAGRWDSASSVEPDANDGRWTKDDVTSLCIDAGDPNSSIGHEPFPNGGIINMGAYGGTAEASKSYFGEPVCETIVAGDINGDCKVDFNDFALMAGHWLESVE